MNQERGDAVSPIEGVGENETPYDPLSKALKVEIETDQGTIVDCYIFGSVKEVPEFEKPRAAFLETLDHIYETVTDSNPHIPKAPVHSAVWYSDLVRKTPAPDISLIDYGLALEQEPQLIAHYSNDLYQGGVFYTSVYLPAMDEILDDGSVVPRNPRMLIFTYPASPPS